ncbi:flagellar motor protein MotB [Staphylococcus phage phiSA039]|nr:flagellar motor protein MotB [Staphylococcus phage phiSA039]
MENSNLDKKVLRAIIREMNIDIQDRAEALRQEETRLRIAKDNRTRLVIELEKILEEE